MTPAPEAPLTLEEALAAVEILARKLAEAQALILRLTSRGYAYARPVTPPPEGFSPPKELR